MPALVLRSLSAPSGLSLNGNPSWKFKKQLHSVLLFYAIMSNLLRHCIDDGKGDIDDEQITDQGAYFNNYIAQ